MKTIAVEFSMGSSVSCNVVNLSVSKINLGEGVQNARELNDIR